MKTKAIAAVLSLVIAGVTLAGCGNQQQTPSTQNNQTNNQTQNQTNNADTVTTASIVDNSGAFQKAISKDGTWIIAILKDLTVDKDLVLEGDFKNNRGEVQRKIALYSQDKDRNITARYTLTVPKLTIKSPKASIQHGTFKGDIYVEVNDFQLVDNKVEGNIYFANDEVKSSFKMDETSSVSGVQEIKK